MVELDEAIRVLRCSTHYEVLNLKGAKQTPEFVNAHQVRKRYKELAILVHPDKNQSPNAESAFKRLSEAYECLVDEISQRAYLQQLNVKTQRKSSRQKNKYKRKRETPSETMTEHEPKLPKRMRTPEEIWQEFQREEEELARRHFHAKGFDRVYNSAMKQPAQGANDMLALKEKQHAILNIDLDLKANEWAAWNKSTFRRTQTKLAHEDGAKSSARVASPSRIYCLICQRKFISVEALNRHEALSKLHLANVHAQRS
ncbi:-like protein [Plasmopara halstedii]|uniref:-like protein n=1 Tax=Plasmopara halstedii TaxID=4781 RepID=A0A0P1ALC4_PLAHL|nr:-like protein [Plasmopara halstedii]CEG41700.1 -like protein [Plasmopara halstedii]|eukprot:XP_024578069.1 -like protein [Plasmopara halstedii]